MQFVTATLIPKKFVVNENGKSSRSDKIMMVYKDKKLKKHVKVVENPKRTYYLLKPEYWDSTGIVPSVELDKVNKYTANDNQTIKSIVNNMNDAQFTNQYNQIMNQLKIGGGVNGRAVFKELRNLEHDYRVFDSDGNIVDQYISKFLDKYPYTENVYKITKGFYDIEVDGHDIVGFPDPEQALCPVNIISYVYEKDVYCFALKYNTQTYNDTMSNNAEKVIKKLEKKYEGRGLTFHLFQFEQELDLIKAFFYCVNEETQPDYMSAWNASFDFPTLYNRLQRLGVDPATIMSPSEFKYKYASYRIDHFSSDPSDAQHEFNVASWTNWIDELSIYANITKPYGKEDSYSLDYIGKKIVGEEKDEYDGSIQDLPYNDYETFILYNIQDTILLSDIEKDTAHIDQVDTIARITNTRPSLALKKTISIRNFAESFYFKNGKVISNNHSDLVPPRDKILGAFVADPNHLEKVGEKDISGRKGNRIFEYVTDEDASQMYPSTIRQRNITPEAELGTMSVNNDRDQTLAFIDDYVSNNGLLFSQKYYGLPSLDQLYLDLKSKGYKPSDNIQPNNNKEED